MAVMEEQLSLLNRALDEVERIYEEGERARREELKHTHSIFSRIAPWLADQLAATHATLMEQHKWRPHEHALALCRQHNLPQHAYFLQRDLSFMREVRHVTLLSYFALFSLRFEELVLQRVFVL